MVNGLHTIFVNVYDVSWAQNISKSKNGHFPKIAIIANIAKLGVY